ncbi:MAG: hypothetical protein GW763_09220, partial [Paraglaciecola sp.]|nr:hypothetical protein [Paraglaciecola sp.]
MKLNCVIPFVVSVLCVACSSESEQSIANKQLSAVVDSATVTFMQQQPTLS